MVNFRSLPQTPQGITVPQLSAPSLQTRGQLTSLNLPALEWNRLQSGKLSLNLKGALPVYSPSLPTMPRLQRRYSIPFGYTARAVLTNVKLEETTGAVNLQKNAAEDYVWGDKHSVPFAKEKAQRYFPGKMLDSHAANGELIVNIYPAQWDSYTERVVALKDAELTIEFVPSRVQVPVPSFASSESVIVTTQSMKESAELLKAYHLTEYGVTSEVVTVEDIEQSISAVDEDTLPRGYKDRESAESAIHSYDTKSKKGYHFELAKKVIGYLRPKLEAKEIKFVTILGTSEMVPPSYYYSVPGMGADRFGVTDMCYGALDQCLSPIAAVGRLPFTQTSEMENYLSKVSRWRNQNRTAESELGLYGGKAFRGYHYIAELGALKLLNSGNSNWRGVKKYFRTAKNYDRPAVMDLVRGNQKSSMIYYLDHGSGNQWWVERESVTTNEVMEAKDRGQGTTPLIASISCTNAAFDRPLMKERIFSKSSPGEVSVGVALLRSKAGSVAYLGSSRPALGQPIVEIDASGNLELKGTTYTLQLLDTFYENYHTDLGGSVGELSVKTLRAYSQEMGNDMESPRHVWAYFNFALLGDPVMQLPFRREIEERKPTGMSSTVFDQFLASFPSFLLSNGVENLKLAVSTPSSVEASLYYIDRWSDSEEVLESKTVDLEGAFDLAANGDPESGTYFLKLENREGVPAEKRVWFQIYD